VIGNGTTFKSAEVVKEHGFRFEKRMPLLRRAPISNHHPDRVATRSTFPHYWNSVVAAMEISNGLKNLFDVVDYIDTALLVTHTADSIYARPMVIAQLNVARTEE
jgi:hypothetical protein